MVAYNRMGVFCLSLLVGSALNAYELPPGPARLVAWPQSIVYTSSSFYEKLPQVYSDKVSVIEFNFGAAGFIYGLFGIIIPRKWNLAFSKATVWHLDATDALVLSTQCANPAIMAEALRLLPTTKAMEHQKENYGIVKIDAMQGIELLCDTIETRINRARLVKGMLLPLSVALYCKAPAALVDFVTLYKNLMPGEVSDNTKVAANTASESTLKYASIAALGVTAYMAHRLETIYIDCGIACFELLVNSDQVIISNPARVRALVNNLTKKVNTFGCGCTYAARLARITSCICQ